MKRAGNLIEKIADIENLRLAFYKAQKGKQLKEEVIAYRQNLDKELNALRSQLLDAGVDVGNYHYFTIYDPKERVICAASFAERVLHHAIMNICHPIFEKFQVYTSYATRKGKGQYAALEQAKKNQKKYRWYCKMDVRKYFDSIPHQKLKQLLKRKFKDAGLLTIFNQIIDSYAVSTGKGIPIGNLTSQYFANYYLAYADHFAKEKLKIPGMVRYMDDVVIWGNNKEELQTATQRYNDFVENELKLELKTPQFNKTKAGLPFLGYVLFPYNTKLNQASKKRFKRKMKHYFWLYGTGNWSQYELNMHLSPLLAFVCYANSFSYRQNLIKQAANQGL